MLHKFFEEGDWFAPKKFGYGAGLPIAWQGWVLLLGYIGLTLGVVLALGPLGTAGVIASVFVVTLLTIPFLMIAKRRTRGGWKWRR